MLKSRARVLLVPHFRGHLYSWGEALYVPVFVNFLDFHRSCSVLPWMIQVENARHSTAVALTHISAYSTHKNLAVHKIMEVMRSAYAKNGTRSQHVSNKTWRKRSWNIREYLKGKRASFAKNILFRWIWKVLLKCVICLSISFRWYALPNFRTQISRPLAYGVCISSKATAVSKINGADL